jgi:endonuclease III
MPCTATCSGVAVDEQPRVLRTPLRSYDELGSRAHAEHLAWQQRTAALLESNDAVTTPDHRSTSAVVEELAADLLGLGVRLGQNYGTPDLGNKTDPVDELVYIILSRRTREGAYQAAYDALKARYATWEELADAPAERIEDTIRFSGLGRRKAHSLKQALGALVTRFGRCTLEPTRVWDDEETRQLLCTLPEVGPKSAACVMMCSLDRPAFPVDAHVGRVLQRLGVFRVLGTELTGTDHKIKQKLLWDAVPPALRYSLHVNLLVHGRVTCLPQRPRCGSCVIADTCASRPSALVV